MQHGSCPEGQTCVNAGDSDICIYRDTGSKDCTNDEADACGDMEVCTPVYSECRTPCDEDNPCPPADLNAMQQGFCFDPSGEPVEACSHARKTAHVRMRARPALPGRSVSVSVLVMTPIATRMKSVMSETFLCEWNGQQAECGAGQYACWNAEGTNYYCAPEGVECQHRWTWIDFGHYP